MADGSIYIYGTDKYKDQIGVVLTPDANSEVHISRLNNMVSAGNADVIELELLSANFTNEDEGESYNTANGKTRIAKVNNTYSIETQYYKFPDDIDDLRAIENIAKYNNHYIGVNDYIVPLDFVTDINKLQKVIITGIERITPANTYKQYIMDFESSKDV